MRLESLFHFSESNRKRRFLSIEFLQEFDKCIHMWCGISMGVECTRENVLCVEWNPCKCGVVIVQKAGSDADTPSRSNICQRGVVVAAVEIVHMNLLNDSLLEGTQDRR